MAKTLDDDSFFLFEQAWGVVLLASVWVAHTVVHGGPTKISMI